VLKKIILLTIGLFILVVVACSDQLDGVALGQATGSGSNNATIQQEFEDVKLEVQRFRDQFGKDPNVNAAIDEVEIMVQEMKMLMESNKFLEQEIQYLRQDNDELRSDNEQYIKEIQHIATQYGEDMNQSMEDFETIREDMDNIRDDNDMLRTESKRLRDELILQDNHIAEILGILTEVEDEKYKLTLEYDLVFQNMLDKDSEIDKLVSVNQELVKMNDDLLKLLYQTDTTIKTNP